MVQQLNPLTFPLHGTALIEASAGTGKTYTIASLYLRLVLGHGAKHAFCRPLSPPEILVVTFTNAATEELRDRIRRRLAQGASFFRGQEQGDEFLEELRSAYDNSQWPKQAVMLEIAAQWMDEAAIFTIHSWCQRMLQQHAFDSGHLFDLELQPDESQLWLEAASDYWRRQLYPLSVKHLKELLSLINCADPHALLKKVRPWCYDSDDTVSDPFALLTTRLTAIDHARNLWQQDFDSIVKKIRTARSNKVLNGNKYRQNSLDKWIDQFENWVYRDGYLPDPNALDKFSTSGLQAGVSKGKTAPHHKAYDALDQLNDLLEDQQIEIVFYRHSAQQIKNRVEEEKQRRSQVSFDDLITHLHDALQLPDQERLSKIIRQQFPVALIDEFQDTDPLQYRIFSTVYHDKPKTGLFMVGDPKQAIYGFRGADIHTYLRARADVGESCYGLKVNFRSVKGAVEAVNQLFIGEEERREGTFLFRDKIPYDQVQANGLKTEFLVEGEPLPGLNIGYYDQQEPLNKTGADGYKCLMASAFATEIVRLLNLAKMGKAGFKEFEGEYKELKASDIAVLVRDNSEAKEIRKALEERQVKSVYLSERDSVFASEEAADIYYLLRACTSPANSRYLKAALAVNLLGLPLATLDLLHKAEELWELEEQRFRGYRDVWDKHGVLPMLHTVLRDFNIVGRLLIEASGERTVTNYLHLSELLQEASASISGKRALIVWLSDRLSGEGGASSDEELIRLESDEQLVKVITIHKSKGLQYPLVFLPFICNYRKVEKGRCPVIELRGTDGYVRHIANPSSAELKEADRDRLAEDLRMLYVGLTRAQYSSMLGVAVMGKTNKGGEFSTLHESALGYLLGGGEHISRVDLLDSLQAIKGDCSHINIEQLSAANMDLYVPREHEILLEQARKYLGAPAKPWTITSYSALLFGMESDRSVTPLANTQQSFPTSAVEEQLREEVDAYAFESKSTSQHPNIHNFPKGPEPGTFLHDLLEWATEQGFDRLTTERHLLVEKIVPLCERYNWQAWAEVLTDWLLNLLATPFIPKGHNNLTAMVSLQNQDCRAELEFMFAANNLKTAVLDKTLQQYILPGVSRPHLKPIAVSGMLKGFIDLLFYHNGRYFVLDYKSNYLGDDKDAYTQDNMTRSMLAHRYDLQYVLYTLALHRLLKARLTDYNYEVHVGGAIYLFLRGVDKHGKGVYFDKPPFALIEQLDNCFTGYGEDYGV